jgi:hypothetical protein
VRLPGVSNLYSTGDRMLPRRRPGDGDIALPQWQMDKVKHGEGFAAWKTGDAFWCQTHHFDVSTPCRSLLTSGGLDCPFDHGRYVPRWLGYVPLVGESGKPLCVVVPGYSLEQVESLPLGVELIVKRDKGRSKPVTLTVATAGRKFKGFEARKVDPVLFERWLLQIWCDAKLASFFGVRGIMHKRGDGKSDNAVSLPVEPMTTPQRTVRADDPRTVGDVMNGVLKGVHRNGDHKG